jgi:hypothetical protein
MVRDGYTAFFDRMFKLGMGTVLFVYKPAVIMQKFQNFPYRHGISIRIIYTYVKRFFKEFFAFLRGYFLPFLAGFTGASGLAFGGRPILLFFIISSVSGGYTAWRVMGFIPALCMRASTVLKGRFKASHISLIVKPSTSSISAIYHRSLINARKFLHFTKRSLSQIRKNIEKSTGIFLYFIDKVKENSYNYT